jgi:Arc/MetJ-type ribon-helix-helix transcriptional regulator
MDLTFGQASPSELFDVSARERRRRTRLVSVRLPEELVLRLAVVGNGEGTNMSETIRQVLERGLGQVKSPKAARKKKKKD